MTNSVGNGIIHDSSFDWGDDAFTIASHNELVIYELHIGTFSRSSPDRPGTFDDAIRGLDHLARLPREDGASASLTIPGYSLMILSQEARSK